MIEFLNITKKFKNNTILSDLSFEIESGELVVLVGLSGCGKTTTLKLINRMLDPTSGKILINGKDISRRDPIKLRRSIGYVIQQTGIFPHMTVRENIEIIPKAEKLDHDYIKDRTKRLLSMVGLEPTFLDRYPAELSGGQQQRVGVARAFALDPEVILMDEPFSALDPITRAGLQDELINIQSHFKKTIVFVTHDISEAIKIADKICIMDKGEIVQYDTPENILKYPSNRFVSEFVGPNRLWRSPQYIRAEDIMIEPSNTITKDAFLQECIDKIHISDMDSLMVVDVHTKKLLGIIDEKTTELHSDPLIKAEKIMNLNFISARLDNSIIDILKIIDKNTLSNIPVLNENGILSGVITKSSLFSTLSEQFLDAREVL